jgi:hypothetical protein
LSPRFDVCRYRVQIRELSKLIDLICSRVLCSVPKLKLSESKARSNADNNPYKGR